MWRSSGRARRAWPPSDPDVALHATCLAALVSGSVLLALRLQDGYRRCELLLLAALLVASVLTRTDAVVAAPVITGYVCLTARPEDRRGVGLTLLGAVAGTLVLHTAFRILYYGDPLPNTYHLKVEGVTHALRLERGLAALAITVLTNLAIPVGLALGYFLTQARRGGAPPGAYLLAGLFLGQCAYSVYVGGDAWEWFQFPNRYLAVGLPAVMVLSALGARCLIGRSATASPPEQQVFIVLFAAICLVHLGIAGAVRLGFITLSYYPRFFEDSQGLFLGGAPEFLERALVAGSVLAIAAFARLLRWGERGLSEGERSALGRLMTVALLFCTIVAMNYRPAISWLARNDPWGDADVLNARLGVALRRLTAPDATIAVIWSGAPPYFSRRTSIDMLGKNDVTIARSAPKRSDRGFLPGHNKWDYDYSIGQLRPDIVIFSGDEIRTLTGRYGYADLTPLLVRPDSASVDMAGLKRWRCEHYGHC